MPRASSRAFLSLPEMLIRGPAAAAAAAHCEAVLELQAVGNLMVTKSKRDRSDKRDKSKNGSVGDDIHLIDAVPKPCEVDKGLRILIWPINAQMGAAVTSKAQTK